MIEEGKEKQKKTTQVSSQSFLLGEGIYDKTAWQRRMSAMQKKLFGLDFRRISLCFLISLEIYQLPSMT